MVNIFSGTVARFAPSPTGRLHLGHAYSALFAWEAAKRHNGKFILRIEDIDPVRCQEAFVEGIEEDLNWLGLAWDEPVRRQSQHMDDYAKALAQLRAQGLLYPCFCTRREVEQELANATQAPHYAGQGPEGPLYPGTCRHLSAEERAAKESERGAPAWRLDMVKACAMAGPLVWHDRRRGEIRAHPEAFGDVVLARKDVATSYHLSVTVDDHLQGVTLVTRGEDLVSVTDIHVLLQALLGFDKPAYEHHRLLVDAAGKRFAKRDQALTLRALRGAGHSPADIRQRVGLD